MQRLRLMLVLLVIVVAAASGMEAQSTAKPLTNQDVILMVKNLMPESVIISAINTNDTEFDVSAAALIALKKARVTPKVIEAVLAAFNNKRGGASAPAAALSAASVPPTPVSAAPAEAATAAGTVSTTAP